MKTIFLSALLLLSASAFAQLSKTNTTMLNMVKPGKPLEFRIVDNGTVNCGVGFKVEYLHSENGEPFFTEILAPDPANQYPKENWLASGDFKEHKWYLNKSFMPSFAKVSVIWKNCKNN